eukprot:CAMPEP_0203962566 /NCGR_PEP_ID=MMETSP0359-20131031/92719_1 /ASSEMBLY_ACC=CAM_ASM_000338 /TAXON_ID=268821 /ORGANISM="Scrippsiella Hangoei, Strain SHTV-5" /LENGTH=41 /DNA_ID= /DNA_START= /DNA_END= /DNA_ORIENTATION=
MALELRCPVLADCEQMTWSRSDDHVSNANFDYPGGRRGIYS